MTEIEQIKSRLREIDLERNELLRKLNDLKNQQEKNPVEILGTHIFDKVPDTPEEKVNLFLRLFRCREDVYPRRWVNNKTNKSGYSPVCIYEWDREFCRKGTVKCSACQNQNYAPLNEKAVTEHLLGKETIGTYAIKPNDTCMFLAADFDKSSWKEDVLAYKHAAADLGVAVSIEISRSGNGAHAWIFFTEPVSARVARQLGSIILSNASSDHATLSLDSYDRFFPNQDYIPNGGLGNLIALPLQKIPRDEGKSVFVNNNFDAYENQWEYLSKISALSKFDIEQVVQSILSDIPAKNFKVVVASIFKHIFFLHPLFFFYLM